MKKFLNWKYSAVVLFICMLILQVLVMGFYERKKSGYHVDELYSLERAHNSFFSYYGMDEYRLITQDEWHENWKPLTEFNEHFTVDRDHSLLNPEVVAFGNNRKIFFKNPYYAMLNITGYLTGAETATKYTGFYLNVVIFVFAQIFLYMTAAQIFKNKRTAIFANLLYGFSAGAISCVIYVRHYMYYSLCAILVLYFYQQLLRSNKTIKTVLFAAASGIAVVLGYNEAEHMVFYGFVIAVVFAGICIWKKKWKTLGTFACIYGAGGAWFVVKNIYRFSVLFRETDPDTGNLVERSVDALLHRDLSTYLSFVRAIGRRALNHVASGVTGTVLIAAIIFIICFVQILLKRKMNKPFLNIRLENAVLTVVFSGLYFLFMQRIILDHEWRYISCIYPGLCLSMVIVVSVIFDCFAVRRQELFWSAAVLLLLMVAYRNQLVSGLYPEIGEAERVLAEYKDYDHVLVTDEKNDVWMMYRCGTLMGENSNLYYTELDETGSLVDNSFAEKAERDRILIWIQSYLPAEQKKMILQDVIDHTGYTAYDYLTMAYDVDVYCVK